MKSCMSEAPGYTEEQIKREASEKKVDFFKADSKDISFEMVDAKMKEIVLLRGKKERIVTRLLSC